MDNKEIHIIKGEFVIDKARLAIIASRFNSYIVDHLISGAIDTLQGHDIDIKNIDIYQVPGAFELPLAVKRVAKSRKHYDAVIALGAVIRGSTPHFDYVAGSCVRGLADLALQLDIPVSLGVLTVDTIEQAIERSGTKAGNKGADAALAAIEMVSLLRKLEK